MPEGALRTGAKPAARTDVEQGPLLPPSADVRAPPPVHDAGTATRPTTGSVHMHRRHTTLRRPAAAAIAVIALAACASDDARTRPNATVAPGTTLVTETTPPQPTAPESTPTTATDSAPTAAATPAPTDAEDEERTATVRARRQALADAALVRPGDLGDGWQDLGPGTAFPMTAELATAVPSCAPFGSVVFDGNDGVWAQTALGRDADIAFASVTVFATADEAAAMVAAAGTPEFEQCWADFNDVAVVALPFGIQSAHYEPAEPPLLELGGDSSTVHALDGTIHFGPTPVPDTCVCVFVQEGRSVVAFHSAAPAFTPAERSAVIAAAVARVDESVES